jgi:hypothetical protein
MKKISIATGVLITLLLAAISSVAQTQSRADILKQIEAKRAELDTLEKRYLSPSEEDKAQYADFLRQPHTGLIRLVPHDQFYNSTNSKGLLVNGGGSYYSFARLTHEYGYGSDIQLTRGVLSVGFAGANYGILTNLGDVPLEDVSLESPGAQHIAAHVPPREEPKARIEQRKWSDGETVDGATYRNRVELEVNSTYVVRSIDYDDSDVLVAFRVVRVDSDDSAIILWKLLKKYPTPLLTRGN